MEPFELSEAVSRHFHLFWDNYPFPVMLIRKDRTILDRNRAAQAMGCEPGTRCSDRGEQAMHKGCLADQALREGVCKRAVNYIPQVDKVMDSYWIPLADASGLYLHFGIDITAYAAEGFGRKSVTILPDARAASAQA